MPTVGLLACLRVPTAMKIVLIGDSSVGKSALVHRLINNTVMTESRATVGIAFFKQRIPDPELGEEYAIQVWDTAGQEKFRSVTTHHYRAADGALLVFDISNEQSFFGLDKWLTELRENTDPGIVIALVGTKCDLNHSRQVSSEKAQAYAYKHGLLYVETSALWDKHLGSIKELVVGVDRIFVKLLRVIRQQHKGKERPERLDQSSWQEANAVTLSGESRQQSDGCAC